MKSPYLGYSVEDLVLDSMTARQRVIYHLYYEEGWTQDEISEIIGLAQSTVSHEMRVAKATSASLLINFAPVLTH